DGAAGRSLRALRERFSAIERNDFFDAPARRQTAEALAALENAAASGRRSPLASVRAPLSPERFRGKRWVTRRRPGVDRMASAWVIRKFIDPHATFAFTDRAADGDVPFDM